jgi:ribosomal protein S18 acetylase RimI-like enzyme
MAHAIRRATLADLPAMARIHTASGTPGLLTDLGEPFLRDVYYRSVLSSSLGRAFVMTSEGAVAGFVTAATESTRLFKSIFRRNLLRSTWAIARASRRQPRLALSFLETAVSVAGHKGASSVSAEVVSLEVDVPYQHRGIGYALLATAVLDLRTERAGLPIKARILADHREVERLYEALGFETTATFRMHGRPWKLLVLESPR